MAAREFLSSFDRYYRFTNPSSIVSASPVPISITSASLLLTSLSSSLLSPLSEATSFFSKTFGQKRLNRGGGYGLEISVKYRFYGQEKIAKRFTKNLKTVKTGLQCKISKCLK